MAWDGHVYFTAKTSHVYAVDCSGVAVHTPDGFIDPWMTLAIFDSENGTCWSGFAQEIYYAFEGEWMGMHIIRLTDESDIPDGEDLEFYQVDVKTDADERRCYETLAREDC